MRKILFTLLILIFTAGVAFAETKITIKGDVSTRGSRITNEGLAATDAAEYDYYDQDMNLKIKFAASKTTWANLKLAISDEEWGTNSDDADENIAVERAYFTHVFPTHTALSLGMMTGGTWGTAFGDDGDARWRIKVVQPLSPKAILLAVIEKGGNVDTPGADAITNNAEQGYQNPATKDAEEDDNDRYAVGAILTFGDFHVKPLYYMIKDSSADLSQTTDGAEVTIMFLALDGKFGMFGFEAEYMKIDTDLCTAMGGYSWGNTGMYANFWANLAPAKVGIIYADGDIDTSKGVQKGFDFDDDFDLTLFLSDWVTFGGGDGLMGMNAIQVYGSYKFTDKMSANASYTMIDSNWETGSSLKGASATEMDFGFAYKITKNLTYSIAAGFASIDMEAPTADPDDGGRIYHKLKMKF